MGKQVRGIQWCRAERISSHISYSGIQGYRGSEQ
jgi:hypothetical protein